MGAHQDPVQRAVVLILAVVSALLDGAFDALVCMTVHRFLLLLLDSWIVCAAEGKAYTKSLPIIALWKKLCYFIENLT